MRKRCEQRDARLDPASLVFPTVGISLLEPISQNSVGFFFFVTWWGLNTRCSLREDGFHAEKLVRSSVSLFFKIADFAILLTGVFRQGLCSKGGGRAEFLI